MKTARSLGPRPPVRVRKEPPTIEEAVIAAQGLTEDRQQQVEIAAGLMGVPEDEVRPHVVRASAMQRASRTLAVRGASAGARPTVVVVKRRIGSRDSTTRRAI